LQHRVHDAARNLLLTDQPLALFLVVPEARLQLLRLDFLQSFRLFGVVKDSP
jgi:hypothetical protein